MRDLVSTGELPQPAQRVAGADPRLEPRRRRGARRPRRSSAGAAARRSLPRRRRSPTAPAAGDCALATAAPRAQRLPQRPAPRVRGRRRSADRARGIARRRCAVSEDSLSQTRGEQRAGAAGTREPAGGARRDGACRCGPARHHAEQRRRGEHLPLAPRPASQFHRLQSGRARAHRDPSQGAAARPRDRDRSAGAQPASGRGVLAATISIRSSSTATPRCSSTRARSPRPRATSRSIQGLLETLTREAQNLLTQQARIITELQNSLMRTRMVPFQRHVQRLTRLVRQAANDTGKRAELVVQGAARPNSIGRCSSAWCRRSSTCCATPSCTASRRPSAARRWANRTWAASR